MEGQDEGEDEDENEGEDEAEDEGEDENEEQEEETDKNDERIGKKCVVIFPQEFAGCSGTITKVLFRGKADFGIEPRNINGYVLQYPNLEFTLFEIVIQNKSGDQESVSLMDIDICFSGQEISYVQSGQVFQNQVEQFVEIEPFNFLIRVGGAGRLAEHCFVSTEQANEQNQNNQDQDENDADDEDDENEDNNTPNDLIPSAFFTYLS